MQSEKILPVPARSSAKRSIQRQTSLPLRSTILNNSQHCEDVCCSSARNLPWRHKGAPEFRQPSAAISFSTVVGQRCSQSRLASPHQAVHFPVTMERMPSQRSSCVVILAAVLVAWAVPAMANAGAQKAAPQGATRPSPGGANAVSFAGEGSLGERQACRHQQSASLTSLQIETSWRLAVRCWEFNRMRYSARSQDASGQGDVQPRKKSRSPGHIFWVVPAFQVAYVKHFQRLTPREKFDNWLHGTYDPRGLGIYAAESATLEYSHTDGFCGYGKGWDGYGKCFGSSELDANISSFFGDFLFPVLTHQDPRYFRLGEGSFSRRMWYAISRVFVTHSDSGRWVFNSSALSGTVVAAAASNLYFPRQDRGFGPSLSRVGLDLGDTAAFNVAAEFWPDLRNKLSHVF